jgi:hypothetical protein
MLLNLWAGGGTWYGDTLAKSHMQKVAPYVSTPI